MRNRALGGWGTWSWPHSLMLVTTQPFRYSSVSSPLHANLHTSRHFSCWPVCAAARKSRPVRSRRARETAVHRREPYRLPQCVLLPLVFQDVPHLRELARQRGFLELGHQLIELLHAETLPWQRGLKKKEMHGLLRSLRSKCACGLRRTLPRPADTLGKVAHTPTLPLGRLGTAPAFHASAMHTSSEKEDIALEATKNLSTYRGFMFDMDGVLQRWCVAKHAS